MNYKEELHEFTELYPSICYEHALYLLILVNNWFHITNFFSWMQIISYSVLILVAVLNENGQTPEH